MPPPRHARRLVPETEPYRGMLLDLVDDDADVAFIKAGRLVEVLVKALLRHEGINPADTVCNNIEVLGAKDGKYAGRRQRPGEAVRPPILPRPLYANLHWLRVRRNNEAHADEDAVSVAPTDPQTVAVIVGQLLELLEWYFTRYPNGPRLDTIYSRSRRSAIAVGLAALAVTVALGGFLASRGGGAHPTGANGNHIPSPAPVSPEPPSHPLADVPTRPTEPPPPDCTDHPRGESGLLEPSVLQIANETDERLRVWFYPKPLPGATESKWRWRDVGPGERAALDGFRGGGHYVVVDAPDRARRVVVGWRNLRWVPYRELLLARDLLAAEPQPDAAVRVTFNN